MSTDTVIASTAVSPDYPDTHAVDDFINKQMQKHRIPGVALAVFEDGAITYAQGYGTAGQERLMTPDTPMPIGSTTKSFTAVAVLQLVEQGRIDLDAPVRTYIPWFRTANIVASNKISVRHLLNHTSGLSELGYNRVLDTNTSLEQGVKDLRLARLTAPAGTKFQYCNSNYATLALVIEMVSGQWYGEYIAKHIFAPLGMIHSYTTIADAQKAGMAQGYSKLFGFPVPRKPVYRSYWQGTGYLMSTVRDLSRFFMAINNGGIYDGVRILSPANIALMTTPPKGIPDTKYGMGWSVGLHQGEPVGGHGGADETFTSLTAVLSHQHRGYVLLMNQQHIIDDMVASGQLGAGMLNLLVGQETSNNGVSMRSIGLIMLGIFLFALVMTIRSFLQLHGWTERSRLMTPRQIFGQIAPHLLIPMMILLVLYRYLGTLFLGEPRAWNFAYVGAYFLPDVALLLLLAIVPDLVQGTFKIAAVAVDRYVRPPHHKEPIRDVFSETIPEDKDGTI